MTEINGGAGAYARGRAPRAGRDGLDLAREVEEALAHVTGCGAPDNGPFRFALASVGLPGNMSPATVETARAAVEMADQCMNGPRRRLASAEFALADERARRENAEDGLELARDLAGEQEQQLDIQALALRHWRGIVLGLAQDLHDEYVLSNPLLTPAAFSALAHVAALYPRRDEPAMHRPPSVLFRHYKGGLYRLICRARTEASADPVVVYQDVGTGRFYVRPVGEWTEAITIPDGARGETFVRRFTPIETAPVDVSVTGEA